jgi:hypothetical protein
VIAAFFWIFLVPLSLAHAQAAVNDTSGTEVSLATVSTRTPVVEIPETVFDFGEIRDGDDCVHAFTIWNLGTGVLEIKKVLPG